jgi:hypothetical protein
MASFKELLQNDLNVFINIDEFGEQHTINKQRINIVIDNDRLKHRSKVEYEGVVVGDILYYAKASDFIKKPRVDQIQEFDGKQCMVFDVREDMGLLEIILKRNDV